VFWPLEREKGKGGVGWALENYYMGVISLLKFITWVIKKASMRVFFFVPLYLKSTLTCKMPSSIERDFPLFACKPSTMIQVKNLSYFVLGEDLLVSNIVLNIFFVVLICALYVFQMHDIPMQKNMKKMIFTCLKKSKAI
jgi:hypothetical protein